MSVRRPSSKRTKSTKDRIVRAQFFCRMDCLKSDGLYLFLRSESYHNTSYTCSPKWLEGVRLSFLLQEVPQSSLPIQVYHAQHCYVAATFSPTSWYVLVLLEYVKPRNKVTRICAKSARSFKAWAMFTFSKHRIGVILFDEK
jgi:hypothetical protein